MAPGVCRSTDKVQFNAPSRFLTGVEPKIVVTCDFTEPSNFDITSTAIPMQLFKVQWDAIILERHQIIPEQRYHIIDLATSTTRIL